ncbi:MAG: aldolase/citrate lyase family protein [Acidobacteriota bacterium]
MVEPESSPRAPFQLILFCTAPAFIRPAVVAGIDALMVDWEYRGKEWRQRFADTQINRDTVDDLQRVRQSTEALIICRVNRVGEGTAAEIEDAIEAGANEILLPMVRRASEVERVLEMVGDRIGVGILVETVEAVERVQELARLELSRVYVGLNDLAIERDSAHIFEAMVDGTLERLRPFFRVPFGFGGLTLPDRGSPIPCRLLIAEMARLDCRFSFLRRSFWADIRGRDMAVEIPRLRKALEEAFASPGEGLKRLHDELRERLERAEFRWRMGP